MARYGGPAPSWARAKHYSYNLREFLAEIGTSLEDRFNAYSYVLYFMLSRDAQRMPRSLRKALIRERLLDPNLVRSMLADRDARAATADAPTDATPPPATAPPLNS